jgi:hypothetical protein
MPDSTIPLYHQEEKTEVTYGIEKIKQRTLEHFSSTRDKVDSCIDPLNPPTTIMQNQSKTQLIDLKKRGFITRVITEITEDNLHYYKELMKIPTEVRFANCGD